MEYKHYHKPENKGSWWYSRSGLASCIFLIFIAYFLLTEHMAHVYQALPWLIFLACPFMHIFMHHGHGGHRSHHKDNNEPEK